MSPGEVVGDALSGGAAHRGQLVCGVGVGVADFFGEGVGIVGGDEPAGDAVDHAIAGFAGADHRQAGGGGLESDFGPAFALTGEEENAGLAEEAGQVMGEAGHMYRRGSELAQGGLNLRVDGADEPQFRVFQRERMPGTEDMVHALALMALRQKSRGMSPAASPRA